MRVLIIILLSLMISACNIPFSSDSTDEEIKYVKDPFNPNRRITEKEANKRGKLSINFLQKDDKPQGYQEKNYFLWAACVDVLSDLPPKISDAVGGIYTTEFVVTDQNLKQSIQCRVLGDKVLSRNVNITVFTINNDGTTKPPYEDNTIKSNVLIRARELKARYDQQV